MGNSHYKGLLVDTNVLLLLLVGSLDPKLISRFKITANQGFDEADFNLLQTYAGRFQKLITTPHILAEVSNHADKIKDGFRQQVSQRLAALIEVLDERIESAKILARSDAFLRFGLTDAAISHLAAKNFCVLTVDLPLAGYLQKVGVAAINFNHLRHLPAA